jgi:hypothetical protein
MDVIKPLAVVVRQGVIPAARNNQFHLVFVFSSVSHYQKQGWVGKGKQDKIVALCSRS